MAVLLLGPLLAFACGNDSPAFVILLETQAGRGALGGDLLRRGVRHALRGLGTGTRTAGARSQESDDESLAEKRPSDGHVCGIGKISATSHGPLFMRPVITRGDRFGASLSPRRTMTQKMRASVSGRACTTPSRAAARRLQSHLAMQLDAGVEERECAPEDGVLPATGSDVGARSPPAGDAPSARSDLRAALRRGHRRDREARQRRAGRCSGT